MTFSLARSLSVSLAFVGRGRIVLISRVWSLLGMPPLPLCPGLPCQLINTIQIITAHWHHLRRLQKKGDPPQSMLSVFEQCSFSKHSSRMQAHYWALSNSSISSHRKALSSLGPAMCSLFPLALQAAQAARASDTKAMLHGWRLQSLHLNLLVRCSHQNADQKHHHPPISSQQFPVWRC